ncbi:hypothetical protein GQ53DRAFT_821461 [Thozetella sp. PMI_491]|nr:hypothetical protein GQ53DRAFT_821461 [Thozetella sp. PMI_491]
MSQPNFHYFEQPADGSQLKAKLGDENEEAMQKWFPNLGHNYKILGGLEVDEHKEWGPLDDADNYNCLGWVVERQEVMGSRRKYWNDQGIKDTLEAIGLVEVTEDKSLVDVWYKEGKPGHVSKRTAVTDTLWTSKLGKGPLIQHERKALEGPEYGEIHRYFGHAAAATSHSPPRLSMDFGASQKGAVPEPVSAEEVETIHAHALLAAGVKGKGPAKPPAKPTVPKVPAKPTAPAKPPTTKPTIPAKPPTTKPPTTNPPTTKPPTTAPPTTKPPTTKPPTTKPTSPAKPGNNPQTGDPNFEKCFEAWKKTWTKAPALFASTDEGFTLSTEYKQLIKLGPAILPQLAAKLTSASNSTAVIAYKELDKKNTIKDGTMREEREQILRLHAARTKTIAANVQGFAVVRDQALFGVPSALGAAAKLMANPLFREIVKEGGHAIVNILEDYVKTGTHGKAIWEEAIKEIYTIEKENGNIPEEVQEFEQWLATYTGQPVQTDDGTEVQPEEPAPEEATE